jgi:NifB/MoaA-like Fe-S oxidoreductase
VVLITGEYGRRVLDPVVPRISRLAGRDIRLLEVRNQFFGGNVAVSGLLVGTDVARALSNDADPAGVYLLPDLTVAGDVFLDGMSLADVAEAAAAPLVTVESTAAGILAGGTL